MRFFIDDPMTYRNVNNKGVALNKWIASFKWHLIPDELSRDAFIEGIRQKAALLDREFPRSKKLEMTVVKMIQGSLYIEVHPQQQPDAHIFSLSIYPVLGDFRFSERAEPRQLEKGGDK